MKRTFALLTTALAALVILFIAIAPASAGTVAVEQYTNLGFDVDNGSFGFDTVTASNSVLLVAIGSEVHTFTSVSFNGVTLNSAIVSNDVGTRESLIYAFDLGDEIATSGASIDIVAVNDLAGASTYGVSVLQVSNADFSSLAGASSNGADITIPTLAAGSLVLDVVGSNDVGTDALQPDGLTRTTLLAQINGGSMDARSSLIADTTGGGNIGWTGESGGSNSAIWIAAVPEPSTAILAGLGLMGVTFRRRRK